MSVFDKIYFFASFSYFSQFISRRGMQEPLCIKKTVNLFCHKCSKHFRELLAALATQY